MKILIAEDDFTARSLLQRMLAPYGTCDVAVDGSEAVDAFRESLDSDSPYDLICLDIMMPNMDGRDALRNIRNIEVQKGLVGDEVVKIIMTTALDDPKQIIGSFKDQCEGYLVKPINKEKLIDKIKELGLI